ncbi:hypothetical protein TSAR_006540 [Trichomalopsis sarcophagae]|uniref:Uncharacterized protein n=1 Tax=Trichomalopsis sarcophagae TaxID=543379 RepID=A0A232FKH1_9HYME|nr:hypothetical protein TSAR_006540 [Trichomalopsis sarcophagae]
MGLTKCNKISVKSEKNNNLNARLISIFERQVVTSESVQPAMHVIFQGRNRSNRGIHSISSDNKSCNDAIKASASRKRAFKRNHGIPALQQQKNTSRGGTSPLSTSNAYPAIKLEQERVRPYITTLSLSLSLSLTSPRKLSPLPRSHAQQFSLTSDYTNGAIKKRKKLLRD